ncbi:hypothetical protein D3C76_693020 [compost metagenome]
MPIHTRRLNQTHDRSRPFTAAQRPGKQPVRTPERPLPYLALDLIVVDGHGPIVQVACQRYPAFQAVIEALAVADPLGTRSRCASIQSYSVLLSTPPWRIR